MLGSPDVIVLHDGAAAALGEISRWGTFPDSVDLSAFIIGTGVGLGVISGGLVYDRETRPIHTRTSWAASDGISCTVPMTGAGPHYEYRPIGPRSSQAEIAGKEKHLSTRMAGKYLFPRLAGLLLNRKCVSHATYFGVLRDMGVEDLGEDQAKLDLVPARDHGRRVSPRQRVSQLRLSKSGRNWARHSRYWSVSFLVGRFWTGRSGLHGS